MNTTVDIIIPCYNEEGNIDSIISEVEKHTKDLDYYFRFLFIDDGSTDNTYNTIVRLAKEKHNISVIGLSRNFGKESAITVGLQYCNADAAVIMDADLQHPPRMIPMLIHEWKNGANIVDMVKKKRQEENYFKRLFSLMFNKLMNILTRMEFEGASDYKLLDRKAIEALNNIDEKNRFFRGLTNWIGFKHTRIDFDVTHRKTGKSKFNWLKLFRLSIDAIASHSSTILHIITFLGICSLLFSIILSIQTLFNKYFGNAVSGFTTVILVMLILSSVIMISIGIIGLYLSKIFNEVKNRPIFIIDKYQIKNKKLPNSTDTEK